MQTHFQFFQDHPPYVIARRDFGRRHEPVETEQQRHKLPLTGRPNHIGQRLSLSGGPKDQPLLGANFVNLQMVFGKDMTLEELPKFPLQATLLGKQVTTSEFLFHEHTQFLTELTDGKRVAGCVVCERTRPPIAQSQHALRGYEKKRLLLTPALTSRHPRQIHRLSFPLNRSTPLPPDGPHSFTKINIKEFWKLVFPVQAILTHYILYFASVQHELQKLQGNALAGCLRTYQYS